MNIPIAKTFFDKNEEKAVIETIRSGWVMQGPKVQEFEKMLGRYIGCKYARATNSGTTSLHLALIACGIGPGDEVILPAFTCIASVNPIEYVGAKPVFVDINLRTFSIDVSKIEEAITENTKAIMPIHLFGLCANITPILELAQEYNLRIIEDTALSLGAFYKGKHAGTFGDAGFFSFHPRKMITTGEGGMVVTNDEEIARKVEIMRNYGAEIATWQRHKKGFHVLPEYNLLGYNYKLTDIQASIGIEQMKKIDFILERRREIAQMYDRELKDVEWLILPDTPKNCVHAYQSYVCLYAPDRKIELSELESIHQKCNAFMTKLEKKGIRTVQGAQALHTLGYYKKRYDFQEEDFPNTLIADRLSIALPIYPQMEKQEQKYIIKCFKEEL